MSSGLTIGSVNIYLEHDIDNLLWDNDDLFGGCTIDPLLSIWMSENGGDDVVLSQIGWKVDSEAHLAANLNRILDCALNEVFLFEPWPKSITDGGGVAKLMP